MQVEEKCLKVSINVLFQAKGGVQFHGKAGGILLRGLRQSSKNRMLPQLKLEVRSTNVMCKMQEFANLLRIRKAINCEQFA